MAPEAKRPGKRRPARPAVYATAASIALLGLAPIAGTSTAQATDVFAPQLVTVDTPTRADKQRLQRLGLDLTEHAGHDYVEVVLHTAADLTKLLDAAFTYDVRIPDLVEREAEINRINAAFAAATTRSKLPSGRDAYRTLEDYNADMAGLVKAKPAIARSFELPHKSLDGRSIYGVEIAHNVKARDGRPTFALLGVHHAREWPSGELAMEFATDLVKSFGKDKRITGLLKRARVVVVPVVNVDGFHLSRTDGAMIDLRDLNESDPLGGTTSVLATPGNAYKRKNCRIVDGQDTPDGSCAVAALSPGGYGVGIDLNRNYGGFWGGPGAGTLPADPTYRGPEAFSEPEIQNVRELVRSRQVTTLISNHTFSNLVLRPNGVHPDTVGPDGLPVGNAPDEAGLKRLGAKMTAANGYANIHGWELYDTTGTTEDWSYNATGGYGYTFEIGPDEFHPPFPEVIDEYLGAGKYAGKGNREAYLLALENAANTRTHSLITGKAPRGAVLRLKKTFDSPTWEGSHEETLESTMRVTARRGGFVWHVNPSTRPIVQEKRVETTEDVPVREETFEGEATTPGSHVDHEFEVTEADSDVLKVELDWPLPDDFDLEVYRKSAGGELKQVGTSGNMPGEKEVVEIADPEPGDYVLRVINYAAASPSYTLKASVLEEKVTGVKVVPGKVERYTLTCERNGKVLQSTKVAVDRGGKVRVNLSRCLRAWRR
ncbi:MAG: M14 family zinc carboxypeptidase [Actinomycetota bacterium]